MRARAGVGFILLEQGNPEAARKELEQAVGWEPENVDALLDLALAYSRQKQAEKAMQYFQRVVQISPDNSQAHYQLFLLYTRNNLPEKAKAELDVFHRLEEMDKMVRREESVISKARRAREDQGSSDQPPQPNSAQTTPQRR